MGRVGAIALAALLLAPTLLVFAETAPAQAAPSEAPRSWARWWNPAWHMRIPVTVVPEVLDPFNASGGTINYSALQPGLVDYPVQVTLDFTRAALEAGWPSASGAIASFTFDLDSIRVVEYDRLDAAGKPLSEIDIAYDFVAADFNSTVPFNASTNAVGTVTWLAKGVTNAPRFFFVYFDVLENGDKEPRVFTPAEMAPLRALGWVGRGHHLTGYALEPLGSLRNELMIVPIYTNTTVQVLMYKAPGSPAEEDPDCRRTVINITSTGPQTFMCPLSGPAAFRIIASRPVTATLYARGTTTNNREPMMVLPPTTGAGRGTNFAFTAKAEGLGSNPILVLSPTPACRSSSASITGGLTLTGSLTYPTPKEFSLVPDRFYVVDTACPVTAHVRGAGMAHFPAASGAPVDTEGLFSLSSQAHVTTRASGSLDIFDESGGFLVKGQTLPAEGNRFVYEAAPKLRTLLAKATAPVSFVGGEPAHRYVVAMGGSFARAFDVSIPTGARGVIVPSFDNTALVKTQFTAQGEKRTTDRLSLDGYRDGRDFLPPGNYRLDADRPVSVFIVSDGFASTAHGYGLPASLLPMASTVGALEFWGPAVSIRPEDAFIFVKPGDPAIFRFGIVNTGRSITGGPTTDNVTLERAFLVPGLDQNWEALLSETAVRGLRTGEQTNLTLEVNPLKPPKTGDLVELRITARSQANPRLSTSYVASAKVIILFQFNMAFADGKAEARQEVKNGTNATYRIDFLNTGTGNDSVTLEFVAPRFARDQGWTWNLFQGYVDASSPGKVVRRLDLPLGIPRNLTLIVGAPAGAALPLELKVVARSTNNSLAERSVVARAAVDVNVDIALETEDAERGVLPGGFTLFPITVRNEGVSATVNVRLDGGAPGFNATIEIPQGEGRQPFRGPEANFQLFGAGSQGNLSNRTIFLNVTAAPGMLAGERGGFRVRASANAGGEANAERDLPLTAFVALTHDLEALLDRRALLPGETVTLPLRVVNRGNGEESFRLARLEAPPGWIVDVAPEDLTLGRAREDTVPITITVPPGDAPGAVRLSLLARFVDGEARAVPLEVSVLERRDVTVTANLTGVDLSAGATTVIAVKLENRGNRLQSLGLEAEGAPGWAVTAPTEAIVLGPNEATTVPVRVQAPRDATPGTYPLSIRSGTGEPLLNVTLRLGSVDLRVVRVDTPEDLPAGTPVTFGVHVRNEGDVTARAVTVALFVDGKRVSEGRLEVIPGNDTRILPIPWTVTEGAGDLRFVVDPDGLFVDRAADNNEQIVAAKKGSGFGVPGAGIGTVIAALAVCAVALAARRRTP
ncbi:MAG TPA: NEW3 domain-containing protein [Candidatus Thermoplasmatota archaeon]|nr:NEW3 domain-containing protein [Candidatus Thermoplasmatota archaeon]